MTKKKSIAERLADIADREGINASDVRRFPKLLRRGKLKQVTHQQGLDGDDVQRWRSMENARRWSKIVPLTYNGVPYRNGEKVKNTRQETTRPTRDTPSDDYESKAKRRELWGYPVTAVVRWMGKDLWKVEEVEKVLSSLDISLASSTIATHLTCGKKGRRGAPANLTEDQQDRLYAILEEEAE